jgi:cytoskeletal protein RodZ
LPPVERGGASPGRESSEPQLSVGRYLARQRRLRGVSLDELAGLTKIPLRSLERLEDGAFDHQADGFTRGFVRTVAEALGLDAEEAVMRLLGEPPSGGEGLALRRQSLRRWALGSALLLGAAAAISVCGLCGVATSRIPRTRLPRRSSTAATSCGSSPRRSAHSMRTGNR